MTDQLALARAFTALADPTRRDIFERVARRPRAVGELAEELPVSRPAVSQHLRVLADAGLVTPRAEGTRRIYEADPQGLAGLRDYLDGFWNRSLTAFAHGVRPSRRGPPHPTGAPMSTDTQPISISASTTVEVPIDEAFRFFTEEIGAWWNADTTSSRRR